MTPRTCLTAQGDPTDLDPTSLAGSDPEWPQSSSGEGRKDVPGASEVSANLYCNSRTSVLGRMRDYLRLLMKHSVCVKMPGVDRQAAALHSQAAL